MSKTLTCEQLAPNKSLQGTFEAMAVFAAAKMGGASNAPELRRWAAMKGSLIQNAYYFIKEIWNA
jgi:hypothetical protein